MLNKPIIKNTKQKMRKFTFAFLICLVFSAIAENLVCEWDFTGDKVAITSKFPGALRPNGLLQNGGLQNKAADSQVAGGFATLATHPELSPGSFRLEVEFSSNGQGKMRNMALFDNQYVNYEHANLDYNRGIMCFLIWRPGSNDYEPFISIGLGGGKSARYRGQPFKNEPDKRHTLAWEYNGTNVIKYYFDGKLLVENQVLQPHAVAPATQLTCIGDRAGSGYNPFDGTIYRVRIFSIPKPNWSILVEVNERKAFQRNEEDARLEVELKNITDVAIKDIQLSGEIGGYKLHAKKNSLAALDTAVVELPVETRLAVGKYPSKLTAKHSVDGEQRSYEIDFELLIGPQAPADQFPIVLWGLNEDGIPYKNFQEIGFNHAIVFGCSAEYFRWPDMAQTLSRKRFKDLDDKLFNGFFAMDQVHTDSFLLKKYPRLQRDGTPYPKSQLDALHPEAQKEAASTIEQAGKRYAKHPALAGALINSEVRDSTRPSFAPYVFEEYKKDSGRDIPAEVEEKLPPEYPAIKDFPLSRIIPDDDPLLAYYRWFWRKGDGWNDMHSAINKAFKRSISRPFWTFYDPAVRVPPQWGCGGEVDYISHWTYAYPDVISVGVNTDEMQAMARGNRNQKVMNMTQIICYRSVVAPVGKKVPNPPAWVEEYHTAPYVTLAPDLMRLAIWTQISRHVQGIMFHGYNSLLIDPIRKGNKGYQCTNLETKDVMADMFSNVVKPLGPILKRIPERKPQIAILESFTSTMFAHAAATWGWTGWGFNLNLMLQYANLQPGVVYEEELLRDGFGDIKVLFMPHCDVLSESVYAAVCDFQESGGIIVADSFLVPGITPDLTITPVNRSGKADSDLAAFRAAGLQIREQLAGVTTALVRSSAADIVTHVRSHKNADFVFVINDRRTFGDYFGQYEMVCEKGLANSGVIELDRDAGAVYDLVANKAVPFENRNGKSVVSIDFAPAEGKLLLFAPDAIKSVQVKAPSKAKAGDMFEFTVIVKNSRGAKIGHLLPLEIKVFDADGKETDDSVPAALENGIYRQKVLLPLNVKAGKWRIKVRELASGISAERSLQIR